MPPLIKIPLPSGKLGIVFGGKTGSKPSVKKVSDDSPVKGKVKEGYVFESLMLADSTTVENVAVKELVEALKNSSEEEGRVLALKMGLPPGIEVNLPAGDIGASIYTIKGKPTIASIKSDAPETTKTSLRVGYVVDKVMLEDGTEVAGATAEEIEDLLAADVASSGRRLSLVNAEVADLSAPSVTLPTVKVIELPTGKLGVTFKGSKLAKVSKVGPDSALRGVIRSGFVVDSVKMPNGVSYVGYGAVDLTTVLKDTMDTPGRKMVLKSPENPELPTDGPVRHVPIKRFGNAQEVGLFLSGDPPTVDDYSSALSGMLYRGDLILAVNDNNGKSYGGESTAKLEDAILDSSGSTGRFLLVKGGPRPEDDDSGEQA